MASNGPHPIACATAAPDTECDCNACGGSKHAIVTTGGRAAASGVTDRARRAARQRSGEVQSSSRAATSRGRIASRADWRRWERSTAQPGRRREVVQTRREQRTRDFERDVEDGRSRLRMAEAEARLKAEWELRNKRMSAARREAAIAAAVEAATVSERNELRFAETQLDHIRTSTDPVWDEAVETRTVGTQSPDPDEPLAVYGDLLDIADRDDGTGQHLLDLEDIPPEFHNAFRDHAAERDGGGVYVGATRAVPALDDLGHLRGVQPRGWPPGSTWDQVPGAYSPGTRVVAIGGGGHGHGSDSLVRHEMGHGVDDAIGEQLGGGGGRASARRDFTDLHDAYVQEPGVHNPYYVQPPPGGRQEMWAEAFSVWTGNRGGDPAAALARHFNMTPQLAGRYVAYFERLQRQLGTR